MSTANQNAGIKYTDLPAATTPLVGTEILCIVQGGVSKQVTAATVVASSIVGYIAQALAAGAVNDLAPVGFDLNTKILDLSTPAGNTQLGGLIAGANGQRVVVTNLGPNQLRIDALAVGSAAANRFREAINTALLTNMSIQLMYSTDVSKWLVIP